MPKNRDNAGRNPDSTCDRPQNWEKAVSAAYLRFIDPKKTQAEVAEIVGATPRTIIRWEASDWWPKATAEALERLLPVMAPPTQRVEAEVSFFDVVDGQDEETLDGDEKGVLPQHTPGVVAGQGPRPGEDGNDGVTSGDAIGHPRPDDDEKDGVGLTDAIGTSQNTTVIGHPGVAGAKERNERAGSCSQPFWRWPSNRSSNRSWSSRHGFVFRSPAQHTSRRRHAVKPALKIDVTTKAHQAAKSYCRKRNMRVKAWVSRLILRTASFSDRRTLERFSDDAEADIWTRPPFWERRPERKAI